MDWTNANGFWPISMYSINREKKRVARASHLSHKQNKTKEEKAKCIWTHTSKFYNQNHIRCMASELKEHQRQLTYSEKKKQNKKSMQKPTKYTLTQMINTRNIAFRNSYTSSWMCVRAWVYIYCSIPYIVKLIFYFWKEDMFFAASFGF